jgi:hypothetical protein
VAVLGLTAAQGVATPRNRERRIPQSRRAAAAGTPPSQCSEVPADRKNGAAVFA